jgi:MATE family multidrug resistance protein
MTDTDQAAHRPPSEKLHLPETYAGEISAMLKLAWPLVLTQLASMAIGTTDVLMLGQLGADALAAAALGLSLFYMPLMFGFGLSNALSPLMSQAIGADPHGLDPKLRRTDTTNELRVHVRTALWSVLLAALAAAAVLLFARPLFTLLGQDAVLSETAASYIYAMIPALPFMLLIGILRGTFSALSRPRPALIVTLAWIGINALFNWIFIFGHFGFPAMGVVGSGLATSSATIVSFIAMCLFAHWHPATRGLHLFKGVMVFEPRRIARFMKLGAPIGLTLFFEGAVFNASLWLMGLIGTSALAAHQIAMNVCSLTFQVPLGVSFAATVRVGYAAGAQNWAAVRRAGHVGMLLGMVFMGLTALLLLFAPQTIAAQYLNLSDPKAETVLALVAQYLLIGALFQLADGQQVTAAFALRGLKDTRMPMWIAGISYWAIAFPVAWLLAFHTDLAGQGVWLGLSAGIIAAAILMTWRFEHLTRHRGRFGSQSAA